MTVAELIEKLAKLPQGAIIYLDISSEGIPYVQELEEIRLTANHTEVILTADLNHDWINKTWGGIAA